MGKRTDIAANFRRKRIMEEVLYERVASVDSSPPWLPAVSRDCRVYTRETARRI
jgi:hypothetical protein